MTWSDYKLRIRALLFRQRAENELEEELRFHLEMQIRRNIEAGLSPAEARRQAAVLFGGLPQVQEECRDLRGVRLLETLWQDVRYAVLGFRRTPGFAVNVVATIALALGVNAAFFTIFSAYVLQPLAVHDPQRLYQFTWIDRSGDGHRFSWQELKDFEQRNAVFSEITGTDRVSFARVDGHLMLGQLVTANHFEMLGIHAFHGQTLLPDDMGVAVVSHAAWTNKFGSDPALVGRKIVIHGYPLEVVGIGPPAFHGISEVPLDFWAPMSVAPQVEEGPNLFGPQQPERITIVGRLREGVSLRRANAALSLWARQYTANRADAGRAASVVLRSRATVVPLDLTVLAAASPLMLGFGLVLIVACANVANMMLARALARQREIGIRLAIGATRSRLVSQLLTECLLLALPAAAAAFVLSQAMIEWGQRLILITLPRGYLEFLTLVPLRPDARVFLFMLAAAVLSALLFGLAPALQATRSDAMHAARGEFTVDFRPARLRDGLVIAQVTVSVLFLICAGVLLRANNRMQKLDVGLETRDVVQVGVPDGLRANVIETLRAQATVRSVATASKVPFGGSLGRVTVVAGRQEERFPAGYLYASPEYFGVFAVPVLRGRLFTREEAAAAAPVAVISQATAVRLWPGQDALGQTFRIDRNVTARRSLADPRAGIPAYASVQVVGIVSDAVNGWVGDGKDQTCIYFPGTAQTAGSLLFVKVRGNAQAVAQQIDGVLTSSVPGSTNEIHPMDEILDAQLYPFRVLYWISAGVGGLALLLTLSGIHGVLSYVVTQRTKEIGIRMALGARPGAVARLVLRQSLRFAAAGAAIGGMAAAVAMRLLSSQVDSRMFGGFDGLGFAMGLALVVIAAAMAGWLPARRAARIEPLTTLRRD